jgi:uncharacterized membrane protein (GlpM family)
METPHEKSQEKPTDQHFITSIKIRRLENSLIVFWLIVDFCWFMLWVIPGIVMMFPTLAITMYITWEARHSRSELMHNLVVTLWVIANSIAMNMEFHDMDEDIFFGTLTGRQLAIIPFIFGFAILAIYYLIIRPRDIKAKRKTTF